MRFVLPGVNKRESDRWVLLPRLCCQAAGGDPELTEEISAAWLLLYIAAHLVDKVEDQEKADLIDILGGPGSTINVANGLFVSASEILNSLLEKELREGIAGKIIADFLRTILIMTSGQHLDINNQQLTLEDWWRVAEAKSGSFFSLACRSGSQLATDDPARVKAYSDYGFHLGMMLQVRDDFDDLKIFLENDHSINLKKSLAISYALEVMPRRSKSQLVEYTEHLPHQPEIVSEIVEILNQSGVGLYMLAELDRHYQQGKTALENAGPISPAGEILNTLLSDLELE